MMIYKMCWFNLRFCKTAKILRAPLRAFDLPIILAAKSRNYQRIYKTKVGRPTPGMRADNFLFASSLVLSFSSTALVTPGGFSLPSGHNPFLKVSMMVITRLSSKRDLKVSLIFLAQFVRIIPRVVRGQLPLDCPAENLL